MRTATPLVLAWLCLVACGDEPESSNTKSESSGASSTGAGGTASTGPGGEGEGGGGDAVSSSSGSAGSAASTGSAGGPPGCTHDVCEEGGPLAPGCGFCEEAVCDAYPFCCEA